jgi:hypothetical protein
MEGATANPGVNANLLTDDEQCEPLAGTPYFTGVPVTVSPVGAPPVAVVPAAALSNP